MRIISFLTAGLVIAVLFFMLMERDRVMALAGRAPEAAADSAEEPAATDAEAPADDTPGTVSVVVIRSTVQETADTVQVRGRTEAARSVEVRAETSGRVISEPLRKGAQVVAGQTLCEIDPGTRAATLAQAEAGLAEAQAGLPLADARLAEAKAALTEARINNNASERLSQDGYASAARVAGTRAAVEAAKAAVEAATSGLKSAQSAVRAAEANVAAARKEIERLTISAPFAGLLESDSAELGALLQAGSLCATVIQLDPIKLVGFLPETEVDKVAMGAMAQARLATGRTAEGRVSFLARSADAATRTFRVEVEVANPDLTIRDGQTAEMVLSSGTARAHLLPQSVLTLDDGGRLGVRIVNDDSLAEFLPVEVLNDTPRGVWLSGLPDTADVIVIGQEYVTEGVPVAPSYQELGQ